MSNSTPPKKKSVLSRKSGPKTQARIKIGQHFMGKKTSTTAEGYVLYKEWDAQDRKNYYWEEWELRGFNEFDSWIEYDHYENTVTLYEPLDIPERIDPSDMKPLHTYDVTVNKKPAKLFVSERGLGTVVRREGTLTYHVFDDEPMLYVEGTLTISDNSASYPVCIEKYNKTELDIYKLKILSKKDQKEVLGRVVQPNALLRNLRENGIVIVVGIIFFGFSAWLGMQPSSYQEYCTPRTVASSQTPSEAQSGQNSTDPNSTIPALPSDATSYKDEVTSQTDTQTCYRRAIYGGGSSGVGK